MRISALTAALAWNGFDGSTLAQGQHPLRGSWIPAGWDRDGTRFEQRNYAPGRGDAPAYVLPRARFTREFPLCPRRSDDKITACYAYAGRLESMGLIVNCVNLDHGFMKNSVWWVVAYEIIDFRVEKYLEGKFKRTI